MDSRARDLMRVRYAFDNDLYTGRVECGAGSMDFKQVPRANMVGIFVNLMQAYKPKDVEVYINDNTEPLFLHGQTVREICEGKLGLHELLVESRGE